MWLFNCFGASTSIPSNADAPGTADVNALHNEAAVNNSDACSAKDTPGHVGVGVEALATSSRLSCHSPVVASNQQAPKNGENSHSSRQSPTTQVYGNSTGDQRSSGHQPSSNAPNTARSATVLVLGPHNVQDVLSAEFSNLPTVVLKIERGQDRNGQRNNMFEAFALPSFVARHSAGAASDVDFSKTLPLTGLAGQLLGAADLESRKLGNSNVASGALVSSRYSHASREAATKRRLVPVWSNGALRDYFQISTTQHYTQVLQRLAARDPLLVYVLQKAVRNLRHVGSVSGDNNSHTTIRHITSDPMSNKPALHGITVSVCCWIEPEEGIFDAALIVQHNMPFAETDLVPRVLRDYCTLSQLPYVVTVVTFVGKVGCQMMM